MSILSFFGSLCESILKTPRRKRALKTLLQYNRVAPNRYTCVFMSKYDLNTRSWYRKHLFDYYKQKSNGQGYTPEPFKILALQNKTSVVQERRQFLNFMKRVYNV